nr:hypothetical protein CFP56_51604 [Quercus suber]
MFFNSEKRAGLLLIYAALIMAPDALAPDALAAALGGILCCIGVAAGVSSGVAADASSGVAAGISYSPSRWTEEE